MVDRLGYLEQCRSSGGYGHETLPSISACEAHIIALNHHYSCRLKRPHIYIYS